MIITAEQIIKICPNVNAQALSAYMPFMGGMLTKYGINTEPRVGAFISNVDIESAHFKAVLEFDSGKQYEGRKDLGNTQPGDGVKFKGRGLIQITGRNNYKACSIALFGNECLLITPSLLEAPKWALESACWYWRDAKNINAVCDEPEDWHKPGVHNYKKFQYVCLLVNGGFNDYAARLANYERARTVLNF